MSMTWLLRIGALAILAVLAGGWAVGLAGAGGSASQDVERRAPTSPDRFSDRDRDRANGDGDGARADRRGSGAARSDGPGTDPASDTVDESEVGLFSTPPAPGTSTPPAAPPAGPPPSSRPPRPTNPPGNSPNPPTNPSPDDCEELTEFVNCALDPVTDRP